MAVTATHATSTGTNASALTAPTPAGTDGGLVVVLGTHGSGVASITPTAAGDWTLITSITTAGDNERLWAYRSNVASPSMSFTASSTAFSWNITTWRLQGADVAGCLGATSRDVTFSKTTYPLPVVAGATAEGYGIAAIRIHNTASSTWSVLTEVWDAPTDGRGYAAASGPISADGSWNPGSVTLTSSAALSALTVAVPPEGTAEEPAVLVVDEARSAARTESPLLVQHAAPAVELFVDGARASGRAEPVLLEQLQELELADARAPSRADEVALRAVSLIEIGVARASSRASAPLLAQHHGALVVEDARAAARTRTVTLVQAGDLATQDARAGSRATSPTLGQSSDLAVASARAASRAERVTLVAGGATFPLDARSTSRAGSPLLAHHSSVMTFGAHSPARTDRVAVSQTTISVTDDARSEARADRPLLITEGVLIVAHPRSTSRTDSPLLTHHSVLVVEGARADTRTEVVPALVTRWGLAVDSARSATRTDVAGPLEQLSLVLVAGARAPTRTDRVIMPGSVFPAAPPQRTYIISAECRILEVDYDDRTLIA